MAIEQPATRHQDGKTEVFDPIRKRYVALTPEEWVRQQTIVLLHDVYGYPLELMQVEAELKLNGLTRRCDVVVYGRDVRPLMIVECKKETVPLSQKVVDQACRYNIGLRVPLLLLTNGAQHLCLHVDFAQERLVQVALPRWEQLGDNAAMW